MIKGWQRYNWILLILVVAFVAGCTTTGPGDQKKRKVVVPSFPLPPEEPRYIFDKAIHSTIDVVTEDSTSAFRRFATGEALQGEGFAKPFDIAVHQGRMFISDSARRMVFALDPSETGKFFTIGTEEPGSLYMPLGVATDKVGNLYVSDATAKRIVVFDRDGNFLKLMGGKQYFSRPAGITVDPDGKRIYVVDTGGVQSDKHRVVVFDAATGKHLFNIGTRGSKDGEFNLPRDVAYNPVNNLIYVVDGGNFRVQAFKPDGTHVLTFGAVGRRTGQFSRPKGITVDRWGNVYVVDAAFGNVQIFSPTGQLLMFLGNRGSKDEPAKYMLPAGADIDMMDNRLYVVDQFYRKVEIYKPTPLMGPAVEMEADMQKAGQREETGNAGVASQPAAGGTSR